MPDIPSESQVVKIWQYQLLNRTRMITEGGELIEITYPGRINDGRGGDFRDAVIATGEGLIKGDIEVHVKSSSWQAHRHHLDPAYNRVVLHVVMWNNTDAATVLENGERVPVLALDKHAKIPGRGWTDLACFPTAIYAPCYNIGRRLAAGAVNGFIDRAGEARFLAKAAGFRAELSRTEASQSLYRGIMGGLGYSRNKLPFLELAHRVPVHLLEAITGGEGSDVECLARQQALLLGTAGLLPSQSRGSSRAGILTDDWTDKLERLWTSLDYTGLVAMPHHAWCLFKVRPNNSPLRRLAAMSYLTLRHRERGLLEGLIDLVKETHAGRNSPGLEKGLMVSTDDCRLDHSAPGPGVSLRSANLVGRGRANDITVNVLLPFVFAWGRVNGQPGLERKALELFNNSSRVSINAVEKHMTAQLGLSGNPSSPARRQQGLIHIYNSLCTQGECDHCRLGQLEAGYHVHV